MLAPTRDLVAELNQRARQHRLDLTTARPTAAAPSPTATSRPSDDIVITRSQRPHPARHRDRLGQERRPVARHRVGDDGSVTVQHARNGRIVDLPASYVAASVELGYACTIHTAQGVTADTSTPCSPAV
jgi:hypothetical protein